QVTRLVSPTVVPRLHACPIRRVCPPRALEQVDLVVVVVFDEGHDDTDGESTAAVVAIAARRAGEVNLSRKLAFDVGFHRRFVDVAHGGPSVGRGGAWRRLRSQTIDQLHPHPHLDASTIELDIELGVPAVDAAGAAPTLPLTPVGGPRLEGKLVLAIGFDARMDHP